MVREEGGLRTRDTATVVLELHDTEVMYPSLLSISDDEDNDDTIMNEEDEDKDDGDNIKVM